MFSSVARQVLTSCKVKQGARSVKSFRASARTTVLTPLGRTAFYGSGLARMQSTLELFFDGRRLRVAAEEWQKGADVAIYRRKSGRWQVVGPGCVPLGTRRTKAEALRAHREAIDAAEQGAICAPNGSEIKSPSGNCFQISLRISANSDVSLVPLKVTKIRGICTLHRRSLTCRCVDLKRRMRCDSTGC